MDNLRELVDLYIQQTGKQVSQLALAIKTKNAEEVRRLAHSAAGASSTCGMTVIVPLLRELERQGYENALTTAPQLSQQVLTEFLRIEQFLKAYLKNPNQAASIGK
jgi:HPt (histidine-containing phosphotransfer) domain-containing protein